MGDGTACHLSWLTWPPCRIWPTQAPYPPEWRQAPSPWRERQGPRTNGGAISSPSDTATARGSRQEWGASLLISALREAPRACRLTPMSACLPYAKDTTAVRRRGNHANTKSCRQEAPEK